jgi:hypothetical protein
MAWYLPFRNDGLSPSGWLKAQVRSHDRKRRAVKKPCALSLAYAAAQNRSPEFAVKPKMRPLFCAVETNGTPLSIYSSNQRGSRFLADHLITIRPGKSKTWLRRDAFHQPIQNGNKTKIETRTGKISFMWSAIVSNIGDYLEKE